MAKGEEGVEGSEGRQPTMRIRAVRSIIVWKHNLSLLSDPS